MVIPPKPLVCAESHPVGSRLRAEIARLRFLLREQTLQTQETVEQIDAKVIETLKRHMPATATTEELLAPGHPIEQIVGTCLSWLVCEIERLHFELLQKYGGE